MEATMSHDYRYLLGKISMDVSFAEKFFSAPEEMIQKFSLSQAEQKSLRELSVERFNAYRKAIILRSCDCDSCCNGGEPKGNCSECFSNCCQ